MKHKLYIQIRSETPPPNQPFPNNKFLVCTCNEVNINFTNWTITAEELRTAPGEKRGNYGNHGDREKHSNDN